jgi:hypothetical protein
MLTNDYQANDTYAKWNNDTVSHIKTCARFIHTPKKIKALQSAPVTGVAQVGMSGLSKVQYWLHPRDESLPKDDPYFTRAEWKDADILPPRYPAASEALGRWTSRWQAPESPTPD